MILRLIIPRAELRLMVLVWHDEGRQSGHLPFVAHQGGFDSRSHGCEWVASGQEGITKTFQNTTYEDRVVFKQQLLERR